MVTVLRYVGFEPDLWPDPSAGLGRNLSNSATRAADDRRWTEIGGWREDVVPLIDASARLDRVRSAELTVKCQCGKVVGSLLVGSVPYDDLNRAAGVRRVLNYFGPHPPALVGEKVGFMRWRFVCPMRRCLGDWPTRLDKLTLAFLVAVESGRQEIVVPVRIPKSALPRTSRVDRLTDV